MTSLYPERRLSAIPNVDINAALRLIKTMPTALSLYSAGNCGALTSA
jgi:hypothetical protein